MKVETDLKAGGFLQDVEKTTGDAANQVSGFFSSAGTQAEGLTSAAKNSAITAKNKATAFWNCLTGS